MLMTLQPPYHDGCIRHSQGPPLPGSTTSRVCHSQGPSLYSVSEHINPTSVSANHYYFKLLLTLWFSINPASTDAMQW